MKQFGADGRHTVSTHSSATASLGANGRRSGLEVGQVVRMVRVVDDLHCTHVGTLGTITEILGVGYTRGEQRYMVAFSNPPGAHAVFESEIEAVVQ